MPDFSRIPAAAGRWIRSMWLALGLLLLLATVSAVGTFLPRGGGGSPFFQSWPYRFLLLLLGVNLAACLWNRRRGIRPLSLASHLLLLAVMGLALAGSLTAEVSTQNLHVGEETATSYHWGRDADLPLPFTVQAKKLHLTLHPRSLQIGFRSVATGEKKPLILTRVGGIFDVRGVEGRFRVVSFNPVSSDILVTWQKIYETPTVLQGGDRVPDTDLEMVLVGVREIPPEEPKELYSELSLSRAGTVVAVGRTAPNRPLSFEGTDIYLSGWGKDGFGNPFVGLQFVRDPLRPYVMGAAGLFALAVTAALLLRPSPRRRKEEGA